jgi:hypothetical protein
MKNETYSLGNQQKSPNPFDDIQFDPFERSAMNNKILRPGILFIFIFILTQIASGWKEQTHKLQLTWQALNLIEYIHKDKYPEEIWRVYRPFIEQGAWDEDFPCSNPYLASSGVSADIRANNHYRHALSGIALTGSPFIGLGDPDVDALTWAHKNSVFDLGEEFNGGKQWEGFKRWGWSPGDVQYGNMSWENAINRYGYTKSSKSLAFYTLGFISHLLQDMGCPEHVHDDPHGASGYNGFEMWVYNHYMRGDVLGPDIKRLRPKKFASLDAFFKNLSKLAYSVNRFHGGRLSVNPPYIDTTTDLARRFTIDYSMLESEWRLHNKNGKDMVWGDFAWDKDDYESNPLWTKGHDNGEWWPTSMEMYKAAFDPQNDEEGYYYIELSGDLPKVDRERQLFPAAFLPKPLPDVEGQCVGWRKMDTRGQHLYSLIGRTILPHIVEHSAGLIEHYYDIVNPPPFVQAVKVFQGQSCLYYAHWKNKEEIKPTHDKITYVTERSWIPETNATFQEGEVLVAVKFSEPVREVKFMLGNRPISGALHDDPTVWSGNCTINTGGSSSKVLEISIEAKDRNNHFKNEGELLDKNPKTPARRILESGEYEWRKYEPGQDFHHKIKVGKPRVQQKQEFQREETPKIEDPKMQGLSFSGIIYYSSAGAYTDQPGSATISITPDGQVSGSFNVSFNKTLLIPGPEEPFAKHSGSYSGSFSGRAVYYKDNNWEYISLKDVYGKGQFNERYEDLDPWYKDSNYNYSMSGDVTVTGSYNIKTGEGEFKISIWGGGEGADGSTLRGHEFRMTVKR